MKIRKNQLETNNLKRLKNSRKPMTLVIGMKCKEGVILISDRKVSYEGEVVGNEWTQKISNPLERVPLYMSSSGKVHLFFDLNSDAENRIKEEVKKQSNYKLSQFTRDLPTLLKKVCTNELGICEDELDLIYIYHNLGRTYLKYIDYKNIYELNYAVCGRGRYFIKEFLEKHHNADKDFKYNAKLAIFCILYVQNYIKDASIGVESGKLPDMCIIRNDGTHGLYPLENGKEILEELKDKVNEFNKLQDSLKF